MQATAERSAPRKARAPREESGGYPARTRGLAVSVLAISPLVAVYEGGLALARSTQINGADALLRHAFAVLGPEAGVLAWRLALLAALAAATAIVVRRRLPAHRDLPLLALEGLAYGALLGPVALALQRRIAPLLSASGRADDLALEAVLSVGAGVWEEIVFRLGLLSAIYVVATRASATLAAARPAALAVAIVLSSLAFSAFHHAGPGGEPLHAAVFLYRTVAGAVLGALFVARGLGVVVYTHAAYDLLVTFAP